MNNIALAEKPLLQDYPVDKYARFFANVVAFLSNPVGLKPVDSEIFLAEAFNENAKKALDLFDEMKTSPDYQTMLAVSTNLQETFFTAKNEHTQDVEQFKQDKIDLLKELYVINMGELKFAKNEDVLASTEAVSSILKRYTNQ